MSSRTRILSFQNHDKAADAVNELRASDTAWKIAVVGPSDSIELRDRTQGQHSWATSIEGDITLVIATMDGLASDN